MEQIRQIIRQYIIDPTLEDGSYDSDIEEWYLVNVIDFPIEDWDYENRFEEFENARNGVWDYFTNVILLFVIDNGYLPEGRYPMRSSRTETEWVYWLVDNAFIEEEGLFGGDECIPYLNGLIKQNIREEQLKVLLD